jgi:hypothetical protein
MTLSNNRGAALVILIIVITITGLIGAGILSMMGAKQRSYAFQLQSYQAYMLAHAGVEFAIRYAYDNKDGFKNLPITYIPSSSPGKSIVPFGSGNGSFELIYDHNANNGTLTSIGQYGATQRTIRLINFRNYAKLN